MSEHRLKTWPEHFTAITQGLKTFEVREDDRGFAVGDTLVLEEYDPATRRYSGRYVAREVTHILRDYRWGIQTGHVVMGLARLASHDAAIPDEQMQRLLGLGLAVLEAWQANPITFSELPADMETFVDEYLEGEGG